MSSSHSNGFQTVVRLCCKYNYLLFCSAVSPLLVSKTLNGVVDRISATKMARPLPDSFNGEGSWEQ